MSTAANSLARQRRPRSSPDHREGGQVETIDPRRTYRRDELIDKRGRGAKITSMPDRSKGYARSAESQRIITEQVVDLAEHLFKQGVDFDEDDANWLVVPDYPLPPQLVPHRRHHRPADRVPERVPDAAAGRLLPAGRHPVCARQSSLRLRRARRVGRADPGEGWKWYCVYIDRGAWRPSRNWRHGDNLFTYFTLIREAMSSNR